MRMRLLTRLGYRRPACVWLAAVLLLGGCSSARRNSAAAAVPFAAVGDTVMTPFQGLGYASRKLIELGDEHLAHVREEKKDNITLPAAEPTAGVYYVPGYLLYPFQLMTPSEWYPMTKACNEAMQPPEAGATNKVDAATAPAPEEEFIEF